MTELLERIERNAISQAISHGADEMCRRSIALRRYVAMITGKPMVKGCPTCPYRKCIIKDADLMKPSREDGAEAIRQRREALRLAHG